jgi:glycosyltransferase involved in cell wall biosynthesis
MIKVAVVIPAYNEEASIEAVVYKVNSLNKGGIRFEPIVVNDASADDTAKIASDLDCTLIDLPVNLGIGGAVQSGYIYAFENRFDYAIQVDGDGQHPIEQIPLVLQHMQENNADVVIGSRFITNEGFQSTWMRRLGIRYLQFVIRFLTRKTITDATSGFRMFNHKVLALVSETYPDEYPEPESMIMFLRKGMKVEEVAVHMSERQGGVSSIRYFNQLYYFFKVSLAMIYTYLKTKK